MLDFAYQIRTQIHVRFIQTHGAQIGIVLGQYLTNYARFFLVQHIIGWHVNEPLRAVRQFLDQLVANPTGHGTANAKFPRRIVAGQNHAITNAGGLVVQVWFRQQFASHVKHVPVMIDDDAQYDDDLQCR
jgi:hypothetical protein